MANRYSVPIPEPTEEGKVLTVVNGEWQAAEGGGGGGILKVTADENITLNHTWKEIFDALTNGYYVSKVTSFLSEVSQTQILTAYIDGSDYVVEVGAESYTTDSENGFPSGGLH